MSGGYCNRIAVVDLGTHSVRYETLEPEFVQRYIGGRGFIVRWLMDMVPSNVDALDSENVLIFATGPLTGTLAPTASRMAVGALAPETGIYSIGSVGGSFGTKLKRAGLDAVILKGCSQEPVYLLITNKGIQFKSAQHLWGKDIYQTEDMIRRENRDTRLSVAAIGQAGETRAYISTIMFDRVRSAGRGGLGAVMGSKNLKAIAVHGKDSVPIHDPQDFWQCSQGLQKQAVKQFFTKRWRSGTYGALTRYNEVGALTTRNAQQTAFEYIDQISAEHYNEHFKIGMRACVGCSMPCWSIYTVRSGDHANLYSDSVNASTFKELGARCGIHEMDAILQAHDDLNRYGLDTISTPAVISFAMECYQRGLLPSTDLDLSWGKADAVITLIKQIALNEGLGSQLAYGVRHCAQEWGEDTIPYALHVKGMETVATDPRGQPSWGLGYATSSRGACHMRAYGNFEYGGMDEDAMLRISGTTAIAERFGVEGKGRAVAFLEDMHAFGDSLGTCKFMTRAELGFPEVLAPLLNAATGMQIAADELYTVGERISNLERIANLQRGITPKDDTLPERYLVEASHEGLAEGKVCNLQPMLEEYYQSRCWNWEDGYPTEQKLNEIGIDKLGKDR